MEQLEATIKCGHCGNIGNCKVKASHTFEILVEATGEYDQRMWLLFQCPSCSRPILGECIMKDKDKFEELPEIFKFDMHFAEGRTGRFGELAEPILFENFSDDYHVLYPTSKTIENQWVLPYNVSSAYSSALRVQKSDAQAFAIMTGKVLEAICKHEEVRGKALVDKISSLADSGRIPQSLADMFTQLRLLRNLAAHSDENNYRISEVDVPIIREFLDAILEYLYIAPKKITQLQDRINGKCDDDFELPSFGDLEI